MYFSFLLAVDLNYFHIPISSSNSPDSDFLNDDVKEDWFTLYTVIIQIHYLFS